MASLVRSLATVKASGLRRATPTIYNVVRNHWNYQYKPGPYPRTPEERAAAAKRYGLTTEEYEPYPEEMCYGDYPKLPEVGADSRDAYYPWDSPAFKRNFNEPMHVSAEIYGSDRYDPARLHVIPPKEQVKWFFGVMTGAFTLYYMLNGCKMGRPVMKKQMPCNPGPHYTFDQ